MRWRGAKGEGQRKTAGDAPDIGSDATIDQGRSRSRRMSVTGLPRVLLFDLDDTILRFSAGQPNFWQHALQHHLPEREDLPALLAAIEQEGREFWAPAERAFWGRQNMQAARRLVASAALSRNGVDAELCQQVADMMNELKEAGVRPFDGALETLTELRTRGHRLALLTNGCSLFQRRKLTRYTLEPLFELILIEGELGYGKPDPRVFEAALEHFRATPDEAWMIGDNLEADIGGAQALGIAGVWHDAEGRGLPSKPHTVPRRVIRHLPELLEL
jgi:putative hydrolase of the HAD superfamily